MCNATSMVGKIIMSPAVLKSMTQQVSFTSQSTICKFSYARMFFMAINTKLKNLLAIFYSEGCAAINFLGRNSSTLIFLAKAQSFSDESSLRYFFSQRRKVAKFLRRKFSSLFLLAKAQSRKVSRTKARHSVALAS